MKYSGFTLRSERYILATEVIEQTSKLCQGHKEEALRATPNFIVGKVLMRMIMKKDLLLSIVNHQKILKKEQRVQLTSYHIYMEKEKEKVEELFQSTSQLNFIH